MKPPHVAGTMEQAAGQQVETVAEFAAGFSEGAYGVAVGRKSQLYHKPIEIGSDFKRRQSR
ncbi:hypothetical protein ACFPYJ_26190 [Paenibacillus solisilvae]|uniref:Uncharacterized protein n=1 Tax=Paenibacillus solisilvae TaxID=2486751 RepID=A0ABW0W7T3_9BACL